jgi:hypothetical protein
VLPSSGVLIVLTRRMLEVVRWDDDVSYDAWSSAAAADDDDDIVPDDISLDDVIGLDEVTSV